MIGANDERSNTLTREIFTHAVASMASGLKTHPDTDKPTLNGLALLWQIRSLGRILTDRRFGDLESRRRGRLGRGS